MPIYSYKAKKPGGGTVSGTVNAQNESEAVGDLRRQGLTVVSMGLQKGGSGGEGARSSLFRGGKAPPKKSRVKVKSQDMVVFTRQLSTMISAGIPLVEAIEILADQASNLGFKATLEDIAANVRAGKDLSQALSQHPRVFPDIYVNMIRAGEASGQLDTVLSRLADYQEASEKLKAEIKSAMTYPVVSLVMVLGITLFLLVFIIPKFEDMFNTMDVELPAVTKALIATSLFLKNNLLYWSLGTILAGVLIYLYVRTEKGATQRDWLILKMPIFGPLFSKVALSRFSRTFGTLIQ
ncbi:MAG: type II secretion system F family protein, partial [Planctomycetes bacterium]|nr:type II secretion system F family protein [Planctomycetota bacterium]